MAATDRSGHRCLLIFGTVYFSQEATAEKQKRKDDKIVATFRTQNAVLLQQQKDLATGCQLDLKFWNTFQRVIGAATHPPSLAGDTPDLTKVAAFATYRQSLIDSVGDKPAC